MNAREIAFQTLQRATPTERAAFLIDVCGSNVDLRRQVEQLLQADSALGPVDQLLAGRAAYDPTVVADLSQLEQAGSRIGPYKLLQPLGEGGMGVVYMAEQTEPIARRVALKIIKPGIDTRQVIARFEAERQALALMDHPCIAKVYDAGATASGRPYFVMELVKGVPITTYCDKEQLPVARRLELFVRVCQGVQHAHQKGIIHRDIKPSNILVALHDGAPVPTIIDFGLAKATGQRLTEKTLFTDFGQIVGTLEYMSPEQAEHNQLNIDTRTDIYSLGAVLYELLTGTPPLDRVRTRSAAFDEILRIIREEEPKNPSTRVSSLQHAELSTISQQRGIDPRKLPTLFRAELDWVVMKALDKKRTRRYETANDMARDLQRYLANEAVEARPASAAYRLRKFTSRHKAATAAAISGILVLLAATAGLAVSNRLISQEQSRTENALNASRLSEVKASRNAELADQQRNIAQQQRDEKARQLYGAHMQIAHQEWKENHAARTRELLDSYLPEKHGGNDLRGWEWHYLWRLSHSELRVTHHATPALAIAYLPDGKSFVTGDGTGVVRFWNADGTQELRSWTAHHNPDHPESSRVQKVVISSDGSVLATAGTEGGVKLWDIATGTLQRTFPSLAGNWSGLAMSADHTRIAVPSYEQGANQITILDMATGDVVRRFPGSQLQFAFSADGRRLAAVGSNQVQQWNVDTGEEIKNITTNGHRQTAVAVSPDGHTLVSGDASGAVMFWDADSGMGLMWKQAHSLDVARVVFSSDGSRLASASADSTIRIWDVKKRAILQTYRGHDECVDACFAPNSDVVATCGWDRSIRFWDALSEAEPDWRSDHWYTNHVEFSPDGRTYALSDNKSISVHDATTGSKVWTAYFELRNEQTPAILTSPWGFDAQGRWIAAGEVREDGGYVRFCDMKTGNSIRTFQSHNHAVSSLRCFPDGRMATGSADGEIVIWNADGEHEAARFRAHEGDVVSLAVSPDSRLIASGSAETDLKIHIWNAADGRHVQELTGSEGTIRAMVFSRDGQTLYSVDRSGLLRSWEVATGRTLVARIAGADSLAISPDGKRIASCGDQTVKIWDATLDMELLTIRCNKGPRRSLSFSPDGWRLAAGGLMRGEIILDARPLTAELRAAITAASRVEP